MWYVAVPRYPPTRSPVRLSNQLSRFGKAAVSPANWRERNPKLRSTTRHGLKGLSSSRSRSSRQSRAARRRKFAVRLALAKPAGVQEVEYYVLGLGPVMVFRDEDYSRNINMEDGPKLSKPEASRGGAGSDRLEY